MEFVMSNRILRLDAVLERTGLTRRTLYQEISAERFPKAIQLTARCVGWSEEDVDKWIDAKIAASKPGKAA